MHPRSLIVRSEKPTASGLCEAVTITPIVFPSSLLLLNAARTPTRKRVESRILALQRHWLIDKLRDRVGPHTALKPAVPYWKWMALGFGWRSDNRRSSLMFRGIAEVARDEGFRRVTEGVSNAKSQVGDVA